MLHMISRVISNAYSIGIQIGKYLVKMERYRNSNKYIRLYLGFGSSKSDYYGIADFNFDYLI